jgi:hypothetical protein
MITSWRERFIALTTGTVRTTIQRMMGSMMGSVMGSRVGSRVGSMVGKMSVLRSDLAVFLFSHPVPDSDFTRFHQSSPLSLVGYF